MMTQVTAGEWAGDGVRVNAVAPGVERTPMWDADVARGAIDEDFYQDLVPTERIGDPPMSASWSSTCAPTAPTTSPLPASRSTEGSRPSRPASRRNCCSPAGERDSEGAKV